MNKPREGTQPSNDFPGKLLREMREFIETVLPSIRTSSETELTTKEKVVTTLTSDKRKNL